jgi:ankyrin repeat protein
MSSKIPKNVEELQNLKNMVNNNVIEMIKPSIKQKSNENVLKFMDVIKERPESWFEFISIAIFHQNFQIMKYMIETFRIVPSHNPSLNALNFYNDILPDNSELKIKDYKELYLDFDCPLILQACIGGDEEIFLYLMKHQFGKNLLDVNGFIGLSKKYKNAFTSNLIGACCYYGRYKLLEYLIKNYKFNLDFPSIERKAKNKHSGFIKEYTGLTPISLAILSEISKEDNVIKIIKLLNESKCSLTETDFFGNNILHIAVKRGKLKIIKFIFEELEIDDLPTKTNKEGQTPMAIAQLLNKKEVLEYLKKKTEIVDDKLEKDLLELIETSHKKNQGKKRKGKKNDNIPLLNKGGYKESLQI